MNLLALTGVSGPTGIFGPGGLFDQSGGDKKSSPAATVAPPVAVTAGALSPMTLLAAGAGVLVLMMVMRR